MSLLDELKKNRGQSLQNMADMFDKKTRTNESKDDRFWSPTKDKAGNATAIIRFLPQTNMEVFPFVPCNKHYFKIEDRVYFEDCLTAINQKCPCCELNVKLYKSGDEATAKARKRQIKYISNILVIKDPANPENEGKVKLFKYGVKIFDKIKARGGFVSKSEGALVSVGPAEGDEFEEAPVDIFDPFVGCNFKVKVKMVGDYPNYDESLFGPSSALAGGDETKMEEILGQMHDLQEFVDPKKFKSYDELKQRLDEVLGNVVEKTEDDVDVDEELSSLAGFKQEPKQEVKPDLELQAVVSLPSAENKVEEDDVDAFFKNLNK